MGSKIYDGFMQVSAGFVLAFWDLHVGFQVLHACLLHECLRIILQAFHTCTLVFSGSAAEFAE